VELDVAVRDFPGGGCVGEKAGTFQAERYRKRHAQRSIGARLRGRIGTGRLKQDDRGLPRASEKRGYGAGTRAWLAGEEFLGDFVGDGVDGFFADALGAECGEGDGGEVEVARWLGFDFR
jgi:hypothetical protein